MHLHRIVAFNEDRLPSIAVEQACNLLMCDMRQYSRIADLIFVEMKYRKYSAVIGCIQELIGMPCSSQRSRLSLTVTDNNGSDKIRIVKYGTKCMSYGITELTTLIYGTGCLRSNVA